MELKGKVALVTGGAVRVGKAITLMLAEAGAHVVVNYNTSAQPAQETVAAAQALGVDALAIRCDVADYEDVQAMTQQILERFGGVDIIVNSASLFGKLTVPTDDLTTWRRVTRISIDGAFFVVNALAHAMLARGGGAIVNIVDLSVWQPWPGFTAHAVGKAGLMALTQQLALELAPTIRVNAVAPGPVLPPDDYDEQRLAAVAARTLLERWGQPEDVAQAVKYLLSADYVTGEVISVDGGERHGFRKRRWPWGDAMIVTRTLLEEREAQVLAPYAMHNSASRGRFFPEELHPYRLEYQRDRDRIIHTTAFRRLEYKTQVFVYSEGDHYRNRLTHSIEVAQIGRTLARGLGCNEDLTEAICLAHDLGHPPFGHVGEETLNGLMQRHGGFDHQRQTYRVLTELEHRYLDHPGLNLTYEVLEGVVKHDTDYDVVDASEFAPEERGTLECQLSNLADEIAYNTSDLDDGLRAGLLDPAAVANLALAQRALAGLNAGPQPDLRHDLLRHRFIRRLVGIEVTDAIAATGAQLDAAGVASLDDLRRLPENVARYSTTLAAENRELKHFLYHNFYRNYRVVRMAVKAERTLTALFGAYVEQPQQLPPETQEKVAQHPDGLHRVVCDYIAGMTDRYAIQEYRRLYDMEERA